MFLLQDLLISYSETGLDYLIPSSKLKFIFGTLVPTVVHKFVSIWSKWKVTDFRFLVYLTEHKIMNLCVKSTLTIYVEWRILTRPM